MDEREDLQFRISQLLSQRGISTTTTTGLASSSATTINNTATNNNSSNMNNNNASFVFTPSKSRTASMVEVGKLEEDLRAIASGLGSSAAADSKLELLKLCTTLLHQVKQEKHQNAKKEEELVTLKQNLAQHYELLTNSQERLTLIPGLERELRIEKESQNALVRASEDQRREIATLRSTLERNERDRKQLMENLSKYEARVEEGARESEKLMVNEAEMKQEIFRLRERLSEATTKFEAAYREVENLRMEKEDARKTIALLKDNIDSTTFRTDSTNRELQESRNERNNALERIRILQESVNEMTKDKESDRKEIINLRANVEQLTVDIRVCKDKSQSELNALSDEHRRQMTNLQRERDEGKEQLKFLQSSLQQLTMKSEEERGKYNALLRECNGLKHHVEDMRNQLEQKTVQLDKVEAQLKVSGQQLKGKIVEIESLEQELVRLRNDKEMMIVELGTTKEEAVRLYRVIETAEEKRQKSIMDCQEMDVRLARANSKISELENLHFELINGKKQLERENDALKESVKMMRQQSEDLAKMLSESQNEILLLRQDLSEAKTNISWWENQLNDAQREKQKMIEILEKSKAEINDKDLTIHGIESEMTKIKSERDAALQAISNLTASFGNDNRVFFGNGSTSPRQMKTLELERAEISLLREQGLKAMKDMQAMKEVFAAKENSASNLINKLTSDRDEAQRQLTIEMTKRKQLEMEMEEQRNLMIERMKMMKVEDLDASLREEKTKNLMAERTMNKQKEIIDVLWRTPVRGGSSSNSGNNNNNNNNNYNGESAQAWISWGVKFKNIYRESLTILESCMELLMKGLSSSNNHKNNESVDDSFSTSSRSYVSYKPKERISRELELKVEASLDLLKNVHHLLSHLDPMPEISAAASQSSSSPRRTTFSQTPQKELTEIDSVLAGLRANHARLLQEGDRRTTQALMSSYASNVGSNNDQLKTVHGLLESLLQNPSI